MQVRKYLLIGLFSNLELNSFANIKVLRQCHLNLNGIPLLGYGGMDFDPCGPTMSLEENLNHYEHTLGLYLN